MTTEEQRDVELLLTKHGVDVVQHGPNDSMLSRGWYIELPEDIHGPYDTKKEATDNAVKLVLNLPGFAP